MTRLQQILSGLLILQIIAIVALFLPRNAPEASNEPLFGELNTEEVTKLSIIDNAGTLLELAKDGENWVLTTGGNYPADGSKILPILDKLALIKTNRLVAENAGNHRRLQVAEDDFLRQVVLTLNDGSTQTLYVGSSPSARATHVRLANQNATYLTSEINVFELNTAASNWIDTTYVNLTLEEITSLTLENANGTFSFSKGQDGTWILADLTEGEIYNQVGLDGMLSRLTSLRMSKPLGTTSDPGYGLDTPQARVTVTAAGKEYTLLVGVKDEVQNSYTTKWSESAYYAQVAGFSVETFISNNRDSFLQQPTPAPVIEDLLVTPIPSPAP